MGTIRIGCGVYIKLCSNVRNAAAFGQYKEKVLEFCAFCRQNKPQVAELCNAIESSMKQMDPTKNMTMHTQETYQKQPNQQQPQQQQQVKQVKKNSVVQDNNNYGQPQMQQAQPVNPQGGGVPDVGVTKSYEEVKSMNVPNKEAYLSDDEFVKVMGMNKEAFYKLRPWKQKNIKRAKGLF